MKRQIACWSSRDPSLPLHPARRADCQALFGGGRCQTGRRLEAMNIDADTDQAKTPERFHVSGGLFAKLIFALDTKGRAWCGLTDQLLMPQGSATPTMLGGVMLDLHPPMRLQP